MTDPSSRVPPPLPAHRDPGDAWVEAPTGERFWGRFGAAGLLLHDPARGVLLQHRAAWSHQGGTWGVPGGALHLGEAAVSGALREAEEEAGVPADAVRVRATRVHDREVWRYTTVVAETARAFEPVAGDTESLALAWVPLEAVPDRELHPAFGAAWPELRTMLAARPAVVVDGANVVGSVPDGWWRDRRAAAERLGARLAALAGVGVPAAALGLPGDTWHPRIVLVLEGRARGAAVDGIEVVEAPAEGDDAIVAVAADLAAAGEAVTVVTGDRGLRSRVAELGAATMGAGRLLDLLPGVPGSHGRSG